MFNIQITLDDDLKAALISWLTRHLDPKPVVTDWTPEPHKPEEKITIDLAELYPDEPKPEPEPVFKTDKIKLSIPKPGGYEEMHQEFEAKQPRTKRTRTQLETLVEDFVLQQVENFEIFYLKDMYTALFGGKCRPDAQAILEKLCKTLDIEIQREPIGFPESQQFRYQFVPFRMENGRKILASKRFKFANYIRTPAARVEWANPSETPDQYLDRKYYNAEEDNA